MATTSNRSHRGRGRGRDRKNRGYMKDSQERYGQLTEASADVDESPVVKSFRVFQKELDTRNDRFERIFKVNRDITIESKRLIFLLQRVTGSEDAEKLLAEAADKIREIHSTKFIEIAKELEGQDAYQYLRAYSAGLQEYIEAVTFYHYLADKHLVNLDSIQSQLIFTSRQTSETPDDSNASEPSSGTYDATESQKPDPTSATSDPGNVESQDSTTEGQSEDSGGGKDGGGGKDARARETDTTSEPACPDPMSTSDGKTISVHIPPSEYMLGVADFTGELMRLAINSVGAGNLDTPKVVADMIRVIHNAFSVFDNASRELRRKTSVLRQSLQKVETACYALTVRGSEIPQHMLTDVFSTSAAAPTDSNFHVDDEEPFD